MVAFIPVAYVTDDGNAREVVADDHDVVFDVSVGVDAHVVSGSSCRHEPGDSGNEQPVEHDQPQHVNDAVLEIIRRLFPVGGFFHNDDILDIGWLLDGVDLVSNAVGDLFCQHLGTDEVGEGVTQAFAGEETQREVEANHEDQQGEKHLLARMVGKDPVNKQERASQTNALDDDEQYGRAENTPSDPMRPDVVQRHADHTNERQRD